MKMGRVWELRQNIQDGELLDLLKEIISLRLVEEQKKKMHEGGRDWLGLILKMMPLGNGVGRCPAIQEK